MKKFAWFAAGITVSVFIWFVIAIATSPRPPDDPVPILKTTPLKDNDSMVIHRMKMPGATKIVFHVELHPDAKNEAAIVLPSYMHGSAQAIREREYRPNNWEVIKFTPVDF